MPVTSGESPGDTHFFLVWLQISKSPPPFNSLLWWLLELRKILSLCLLFFSQTTWLKQFREEPPHPWRGLAASHKWTVRTRGIHDYLGRDIHLLSNLRTPGGIRCGARPQNSHYLCHFVAQFPWKPSKEGCPAIRQKLYIRRTFSGNSLVVQWVSLWALTAKSLSSIPGQGTKIRQAA